MNSHPISSSVTEKAKKLYQEYRNDYRFVGFNQNAFQQRVRRLAKQINREANWNAFMYLTYIATRENMQLKFTEK